MARVKICGLTSAADVAAAADAGADFVGCIVHPHSKRAVEVAELPGLMEPVGGRSTRVAVVVDPSDDLAEAVRASGAIDWLQLHGAETPDRVDALRRRTGLGIMKVASVETADDVSTGARYAPLTDMVLFDTKAPPGAPRGGNGLAFDWRLLDGLADAGFPWGLAGGLDPSNVQTAIALTGAGLVDVASGVEHEPRHKDHDAVRAFVRAAKSAPGRVEGTA